MKTYEKMLPDEGTTMTFDNALQACKELMAEGNGVADVIFYLSILPRKTNITWEECRQIMFEVF